MLTKSYANTAADKPFAPYEFNRREVGEYDVGIEIHFCGVCHSDIHTARSEWGPAFYPCVPGHEIVGKVTSVGSKVKKFKKDDFVGVGCLVDSCRSCRPCEEGLEQYCDNGWTGTYNTQTPDGDYTKGGYSNYIVVQERFVLSIPKNLDLAAAAPLLCAGITTYSPLRYAGVKKGDKVAILGLGGLGHMGVKIAASFGAEVTVLSRSPQKEEDARRLGATNFLLTTKEEEMAKYLNTFDYILDTVSAPHDLVGALSLLKKEIIAQNQQ